MKHSGWTISLTVIGLLVSSFNVLAESTESISPENEFKGDPVAAYYKGRIDELGGLEQAQKHAVENTTELSRKCATCHGSEGTPDIRKRRVAIPNIASQQPLYLFKQMSNLSSGVRKHPVMSLRVKELQQEEMFLLALRFSSLPLAEDQGPPPSTPTETGAQIYQDVCIHCHGSDSMGIAAIPRLKGQNPAYLIATLTRFKNGSPYRTHAGMANITKKLQDSDIVSLAAYLWTL